MYTLVGLAFAAGCHGDGTTQRNSTEQLVSQRSALVASEDQWFPIGPSPIANGLIDSLSGAGNGIGGINATGVETTGRASVIFVNPQNQFQVYVGMAAGGLWTTVFSTDSLSPGDWRQLFQESPAIGAIEARPDSCDVNECAEIWVGTGEGKLRRETLYGSGIYDVQSNGDGGFFSSLVPGSDAFSGGSINDIVYAPAAGSTDARLFATVFPGNTSSAHAATVTHPAPASGYGVFRWDGGTTTTWAREPVPFGAPNNNHYLPGDLRKIQTSQGTALFVGFTNRGLYRRFLTGANASANWCPLNTGVPVPAGCPTPVATCPGAAGVPCGLPAPGPDNAPSFDRNDIAASPSNPDTIYATFTSCSFTYTSIDKNSTNGIGCPLVLFSSTNGGTTWTNTQATGVGQPGSNSRVGGSQIEVYSWYSGTLAVHPTNPSEVYFGGVGLWKSTNGGTNFTLFGQDSHPDIHQIIATNIPINGNPAAVLFVANDGGTSWVFSDPTLPSLTHNTFPGTALYSTALHEIVGCVDQTGRDDDCDGTTTDDGTECAVGNSNTCNTQNLLSGAQDNGILLFNGGRAWQTVGGGDGADVILQDSFTRFTQSQAPLAPTKTSGSTGTGIGFPAGRGSLRDSQNPNGDGTMFEPPLIQHLASGTVFGATDRVYQLNPGAQAFTDISGPLGPAGAACTGQVAGTPQGNCANGAMCVSGTCRPYFPDIEQTTAISALAVARGDVTRLYAGLYDGSVFMRKNGVWSQILTAERPCDASVLQRPHLPGALDGTQARCLPATSLEVDPANPDTVYATFGGFGAPGRHVRVFQNGAWSNFSDGEMNASDLPAHVIRINPSAPTEMYLGTDDGVFKRKTGTGWVRGVGFPHVPVSAIAVDGPRGRTYAGTHGRGAYLQVKSPVLHLFEGWMPARDCPDHTPCIWDILVYGEGFQPLTGTTGCRVDILTPTGAVCATGTFDGYSKNPITVNSQAGGRLATAGQLFSPDAQNLAVIAVCFNGACVSDTKGSPTPLASCLPNAANPTRTIAAVQVSCPNSPPVVASVSADCPALTNPPSTTWTPAPFTDSPTGQPPPVTATTTLSLSAILVADPPVSLCSVTIPYTPAEPNTATLVRARDAFNGSAACQLNGVTATLPAAQGNPVGEDPVAGGLPLELHAVNAKGMSIGPAISIDPGVAGSCQEVSFTGYAHNQLDIVDTNIVTLPSGAAGGAFVFKESSPLGNCTIRVPTFAGDTGIAIANRVLAAYLFAADNPGDPNCPMAANPRDLIIRNNSLVTIASTRIRACSSDAGVGIAIKPDGSAPLDTGLSSVGLLGLDGVNLRDFAQVKTATGWGLIGSSGSTGVTMFPDSQSGDVLSVGTVTLQDRAHVRGRIKTGQTVVRLNQTTVDGAIVEHTTVSLPSISGFLINFPTTAGPDITVAVNGQLDRTPGIYANVVVNRNGRLTLHTGDYFFRTLDIEPSGGTLRLDEASGPVRIFVRDSVIFRGVQQTVSGAQPKGYIAYQGTADTTMEATYRGTFAAPRGRLVIRRVTGGHFGAFYARLIDVDANAVVTIIPFSGIVTGAEQPAATCSNGIKDGNETAVDCGGSCGPTCQGGQACMTASDCASQVCTSGVCAAGCVVSAAIDLGAAGNSTTVRNDACVRVKDAYPAGWGQRNMKLQTTLAGKYPVPFTWSNTCVPASGTGQFTGDGQSQIFGLTDARCATLIDLQGSGTGNVTLKYSAGN